ncbi:enoyl-CoA hydratase/isomerase family protein [Kitasatospora sp. GP82]|uniref:enoyl-CoA hydratase/isomerase family protein n=1 Tax=Kitasatospora sp. GP82 TaxID=3035089 RepID=UPI002472FCB5|nr:enoyl-CoA hydratase/isomerase family protein [Kitasatospora sp. GP82]MDH6125640.1 enoyl-CoA hydratase [Kitasatospora sp. GP82]
MTTDVLLHTDGRAARILLNRPKALNALTHEMLLRIHEALDSWAEDSGISTVVLSGAGERGLCAGADIRALHDDAKLGGAGARQFFRDEYLLNAAIAAYAKPYVSVMDGITMGGGVGLAAHGSIRVVTERSQVAMPETRIGLVPDVGGSHLLAHAPGELGTHFGLTAASMGPGDAILLGFADTFVPAEALGSLTAALAEHDAAEAVRAYATEAPDAAIAVQREWIDHCYAADTVEEILDRLLGSGVPEAKEAAEQILAKSPTALKVTLAALRRAREHSTLAETLEQEYRVSCTALTVPDLVEGIRAQVVDKDRSPRWSPATLAAVTEEEVARFFAPRPEGGLGPAVRLG